MNLNQNKMTAVEWLIDEIWNNPDSKLNKELFNKAKEIEKKKTIDFAKHCLDKAKDLDILTSFMNVEQYYKQTFKSE